MEMLNILEELIIKLNGLRIELDEIEFEIKKISNCVVILTDEKYLSSYLILKKEIENKIKNNTNKIEFIQSIKKQISIKLPNYMIQKHL
jgi:hypothetical protein